MGKCGKVNDASSKACVLNEHIYNTDSKRNMSWTVTKFPTVSKQDIGITASGISFRTDYGDGKATLTYEEQDWFDEKHLDSADSRLFILPVRYGNRG